MTTQALPEINRINVCYPERPDVALFAPIPAPRGDVDVLFEDAAFRQYLASIGADPATTLHVVTLSRLDGAIPPAAPFFNDYTNVLTVPAPDRATIERILIDRVPPGTTFEETVVYSVPDLSVQPGPECHKPFKGEHIPNGVELIEAPLVWSSQGVTGAGIRVAVVDCGLRPHDDLPTPMASQSFVPGVSSIDDEWDHGTYVAGIIAARRNDRQLVGVAPDSTLLVARVGNKYGKAEDWWIAAGITWSAAQDAHVINVCMVRDTSTTAMRSAVRAAATKSIICAAAGNDGHENALAYPAAYPNVISVGATQLNRSNSRCPLSNWATGLTVAAPGCPTLSTANTGGTKCEHGTSAAAPHISGVVALMLDKDDSLKLDDIRGRLQTTGEKISKGGNVRRVLASRCVY